MKKTEKSKVTLEDLLVNFEKQKYPTPTYPEIAELDSLAISYCANNYTDFNKEIFAVVPIEAYDYTYSLILYKDCYQILSQSPLEIIENWAKATLGITYNQFCQILEFTSEKETYCKPYTDKHHVLFPTSSPKKKDTLWLNPIHIEDIKDRHYYCDIEYLNGVQLTCQKGFRSLKGNMIRSTNLLIFGLHTNLSDKRLRSKSPVQIADELNFPKEAMIRKSLDELQFDLNPKQILRVFGNITNYLDDYLKK